jgi:hypothetical protein
MSSVVILLLSVAPAAAEKPNPAFAGRIMLSEKRFPTSARSLAEFNAKITKQSKTSFFEDKDKKWKINMEEVARQRQVDIEAANAAAR